MDLSIIRSLKTPSDYSKTAQNLNHRRYLYKHSNAIQRDRNVIELKIAQWELL